MSTVTPMRDRALPYPPCQGQAPVYSRHMAQYNVKVRVGDRVRHKSTGQVYRVVSIGLPPVAVHVLEGATEVVLEKEGTGEPLYRGTMGGFLEDSVWGLL